MKSDDKEWLTFLKEATPEQLREIRQELMKQYRRERPATLRIAALVGITVGLGYVWYQHGIPDDPYFSLLFLGFFGVVILLWSISLRLENIAANLEIIAGPIQLLFYGPDRMGMSRLDVYNLRRKLGMQIEYDWEERLAETEDRID